MIPAAEVDQSSGLEAPTTTVALPPGEARHSPGANHAHHRHIRLGEAASQLRRQVPVAELDILMQEDERLEVVNRREGVENLVVRRENRRVVPALRDGGVGLDATRETWDRVRGELGLGANANTVGDHGASATGDAARAMPSDSGFTGLLMVPAERCLSSRPEWVMCHHGPE